MKTRILGVTYGAGVIAWAALLLGGCLSAPERVAQGGSGTEYTNGTLVVGWVSQSDGSAARNARVWIRPSNYLRDTSLADAPLPAPDGYSDSAGYFHVDSVPFGSYTMEVRDDKGQGLALDFDAYGLVTDLSRSTVNPLGSLEGTVSEAPVASAAPAIANATSGSAAAIASQDSVRAYVQVIGLNRVTRADAAGKFSFPDLPPGIHSIRALSSRAGLGIRQPGQVIIRSAEATRLDSLVVDSAGTENYATWPYARKIRIHASSVGVVGPVADFPLLVRIYGDDSVFGKSDGKDLRFAAADGRHLAFELERWEPATRLAEFWVHLDSLPPGASAPAGSDSGEITMYWGKPNAPLLSDGPAVFASFAGVWHLSEAQWGTDSLATSDASPYAATAFGHLAPGNRRAVWGYSGLFAGTQYLMAPGSDSLRPAAAVMLSAWIRPTATDVDGGEVASLGDNYALRVKPDGTPMFFAFDDAAWDGHSPASIRKWKLCEAKGIKVMDQRWHWLVGMADGAMLRLFVDGEEKAAVPFAQKLAYPLGKDFWIGRNGGDDNLHDFRGQIDEVRVTRQVRSAAWIKLAYENQKSGSTLLEFR